MAKLKGKKKLNNAISKELKPFGLTSAKLSNEFAFYPVSEVITYKLTWDYQDDWLNEFVKERFNYDILYPFVFTLLHEIGHYLANDEIEGAILEFCENEKERIENEVKTATDDYEKTLNWQYFSLPDEIMATQWAVNYSKTHPRKIKQMNERIIDNIKEFYRKNDVTEG